jgi:hypothetical protein
LKQAKDRAARSHIPFPQIRLVNRDCSHYNSWPGEEQDFVLNVADVLATVRLSQFTHISDSVAQILNKAETIGINVPETDEIREVMRNTNPERLELHYETELDLSVYSRLEIVDLHLSSSGHLWSNVLPKIFQTQTVRLVYIKGGLRRDEMLLLGQEIERFVETLPNWSSISIEILLQ